jgi:WD40 repeat protein
MTQPPVLSADGRCVALGTLDAAKTSSQVVIYSTYDGKPIYETTGPSNGTFWLAAFSADSSKAAVVRSKPNPRHEVDRDLIDIIDLKDRKLLHRFEASAEAGNLMFTPDGRQIIFPTPRPERDPDYDKSVYAICDLGTGDITHLMKFGRNDSPNTISADGSTLMSLHGEMWDLTTNSRLSRLAWPYNYYPTISCISPSDGRVRTLGRDYAVRTWDIKSGKLLAQSAPPKGYHQGFPALFDRDGKHFVLNLYGSLAAFESESSARIGTWVPPRRQHATISRISADIGTTILTVMNPDSTEFLAVRIPPVESFTASSETSDQRRTQPRR